ncbi:hypothetical protein ACFYWX_28825 [Streptomyces sp. NPDC002888]|uniref:hypothetical protein n=1 Tax=Streptomyces sp. NPDC002888 TaxID=3364668 RepID=UPI003689EA33
MGDIAKGVLGGAWALLVGWIVPTALNLSVFLLVVAQGRESLGPIERIWPGTRPSMSLVLLVGSVLAGLVLHALQNTLYRLLEGYVLWPARLAALGRGRRLRAKHDLRDRAALLRLERREQEGRLRPEAAAELARLREDPRTARLAHPDRGRTAAQRAMLQERLARYPVSDEQIAPTRLGNAIRRFEEYGYDRFRLDTQVMWHELTGAAPDAVGRQVELARTRVDFFVALFYGHGVVALSALVGLLAPRPQPGLQVASAAVLVALMPVWYWSAVTATDEWAAAVRALVNLGRKPLAESLGYSLPPALEDERTMWTMVCRLSRLPYHERASALDPYRARPPDEATRPQ